VIAAAPAPVAVDQMVVFKTGRALTRRASTRGLRVRVGHRPCAVGSRTPLAALVRSKPGRIRLRDFASCSRRPIDAGGLYVSAIGRESERGHGGWVYKVGHRAATAGAADPSGPFGSGLLRRGQRITWFYCLRAGACQSTLELRVRAEPGGAVATVRAYDDDGRGRPVEGATVSAGAAGATTGGDGRARLVLSAGRYRVHAEKAGLVRSFDERVAVG
jgi:hypothetical protein